MKDHTSHDVLLMCVRCHQISNISDQKIRQQLADQCDAPFKSNEGAAKVVSIPRYRQIKSISRALSFQKDKIPEKRLNELRSRLLELCPDISEVTDDLLKQFVDIETTLVSPSFISSHSLLY